MPRTLIICPTHDHADTLFASIASVQAQRDTDWELVVICDGAPERTVQILEAIKATDTRIRYEVHPKGERLGEAYRDPVIRGSDAEFICHLGDDDIWSDRHVECMTGMLKNADYAMQGTLELGAGGTWVWNFANSGTALSRTLADRAEPVLLTAGLNCFAVRRSAYERLDRGWSPAPRGIGSDVYMCVEYVRRGDLRIASTADVTFAKLPSRIHRNNFTPEQRLVELMPVLARINTSNFLEDRRREAVVGIPLIRAMHLSGAASRRTLKSALASAGLRAISPGKRPAVTIGTETMFVPLSTSQRAQCELSWLLLRLNVDQTVSKRLRTVVKYGLAWLLTPYLETWWLYDAQGACDAAKILQRENVEPEVASAFIVQAMILGKRLPEARAELEAAQRAWPDAGWVAHMNAQYEQATRTMNDG